MLNSSRRYNSEAVQRALLKRSFQDFVHRYWTVIDSRRFVPNTATDAVVATLQAVAEGRLRRVLIEIGPGLAKTTLLALYAAWRFARDPSHRILAASHAYDVVVTGFSKRARRIVESDDYRSMFKVQLRDDENTVSLWGTTSNGRFTAAGVCGALTGHRADELVVDDAINSIDVHSKAARDATWSWFGESFSTRLDGEGSIVVVGQRLGVDDLVGRIRASGAAWTCLTLPSEYDPRRRCVVSATDGSIVWADPRTKEGELLAPAIHSREKLNEQHLAIGSNAFAAQYNQNPSSDETSMAPARWWRFYRQPHTPDGTRRPNGCSDAPAAELPTRFDQIVIAADLTFGAANGDYAVVQAWGSAGGSRFLLRQWRKRAGFDEQVAAIRSMAAEWPPTKVVVERAANGAAVIEALQKFLSCVVPQVPVGGKAQRLAAIVPQLEAGAVHLPEGADFTPDFIEEFRAFPSRHDDQVDCAVWALLAFSSVDPELADKRRTYYRNLGWILSDQYSGAALEEQIQARMDLFDKRHRGEVCD